MTSDMKVCCSIRIAFLTALCAILSRLNAKEKPYNELFLAYSFVKNFRLPPLKYIKNSAEEQWRLNQFNSLQNYK